MLESEIDDSSLVNIDVLTWRGGATFEEFMTLKMMAWPKKRMTKTFLYVTTLAA
jgi:hypothetical protein